MVLIPLGILVGGPTTQLVSKLVSSCKLLLTEPLERSLGSAIASLPLSSEIDRHVLALCQPLPLCPTPWLRVAMLEVTGGPQCSMAQLPLKLKSREQQAIIYSPGHAQLISKRYQ